MWGYQRTFQISVKNAAANLFKELSPDFETEVFLLGLRREEEENSHPVCLEPENCGFKPEDFSGVREDAEHRYALAPERDIITTVQSHYDSIQRRVRAHAMHDAVSSVLNGWRNQRPGTYHFSGLLPVLNYDVGVVLYVHDPKGHGALNLAKVHAERRYGPSKSFLDAVIAEFLTDCRRSLYKPEPEFIAIFSERSPAETLRAAGARLMDTPIWAVKKIEGLYGLFRSCNVIASLTYEKAAISGGMLIVNRNHPNIEFALTLLEPVPLTSYRQVRKLLEMVGHAERLICDGRAILGFGHVRGKYDQTSADLFEVRFYGHYLWELRHDGHALMRVRYGTPELPLTPIDLIKLADDIRRIFPDIATKDVDRLVGLSQAAYAQKKGTLLIVIQDAESEAKRLANQATPIEPISLTTDLVGRLTSIDGALLIDPTGICYAIGVILDGMATQLGDPGRGARYNSSVRYIADKNECMAIIVSEDGNAEWIPNLKPQLKRSELENAEKEVNAVLSLSALDDDRACAILEWLRKHQFYLSDSLCEMANQLFARHTKYRDENGLIYVSYPCFEPHPDMNDEYLI
ncbi:diadenylate cyclase [Cerasicoccus fimbriatus]|uniref:diadenylate cyclase n=1 Tax=Cerasicoccus fimbriatus TaxID=3014554 RepID=UPI0022B43F0E|nr:diadenylate cyclase [Cerasicoccus sp. TK19100]